MTASPVDTLSALNVGPRFDAEVAIICEGDLTDAVLESFIDGSGLSTRLVDLDHDERPYPTVRAVVVRTAGKVMRVQWIREFSGAAIIAIGAHDPQHGVVVLPDSPHGARRLRQILLEDLRDEPTHAPVHLSDREREVIVTYTLGTTVRDTARQHFITENTVRSHFRRVMRRYRDAGRPVTNKSQLLIQLIADGWVTPDQLK